MSKYIDINQPSLLSFIQHQTCLEASVPATRTLSNGHRVEELLYIEVCETLRLLLEENRMRTDDINNDWPNVPFVRSLYIQCVDSGCKMDEASIKILSKANLCDSNGHIPESIRDIILSFTRIEKRWWDNKSRVIITIPPLSDRGPADPAIWELEVDLGNAPKF